MTEQFEGRLRQAERRRILAAISGLTIRHSYDRLSTITPDDRGDSLAFDRAARTALAFLRVAAEAAALAGSVQPKKDAPHDDESDALPTEAQVDEVLRRYADARARSAAPGPDGPRTDAASGGVA